MSDEISSAVFMASQGAGWTGLGRAIPLAMATDPAKIAELCEATYTVEAQPVFYRLPDGSYCQIKDAAAQVRMDTGAALSVTSESRYHTKHRQPRDVFEAFRDELAEHKLDISHGCVLRGGKHIAVSAILPPEHDINVRGDKLRSYVTLSTGYDKRHGTKATLGTIRVVCANTLAMSISEGHETGRIRTYSASQELEFDSLKNLISRVKDLEAVQAKTFDAMANKSLSNEDVARFFADVLEIEIADLNKRDAQGRDVVSTRMRNQLDSLVAAYKNGPGASRAAGTLWGALNAVTYVATHVKTVRDMNGDGAASARVASNMVGDAAKLKARALAMAQSRVRVAA